MNHRTSIYIPSPHTRRISVTEIIERITRALGGCTIDDKRGLWVGKDGLVYEHVSVYSWWHGPASVAIQDVHKIARILLVDAKEEAVLLEFLRPHGHTADIVKLNDKGEVTW